MLYILSINFIIYVILTLAVLNMSQKKYMMKYNMTLMQNNVERR